MPLQNRVTPTGDIEALAARGLLMGNRGGRLHGADKRLGSARWRSRAWITCVLCFKGRRREVMGQSYTELFFLDEVTALAAGHRPCFECRRADAVRFATLFPGATGRTPAPEMDRILHSERLGRAPRAPLDGLPEGTMVMIDGHAAALRGGWLWRWTPTGYQALGPVSDQPAHTLPVLTPAATRTVLDRGFQPLWHPSATGESAPA